MLKQKTARSLGETMLDYYYKIFIQTEKNEVFKFLLTQNIIQGLLSRVVLLKTPRKRKEFVNKIENNSTLGALINYFRVAALTKDEQQLLAKLDGFSRKRNQIVHKLINELLVNKSAVLRKIHITNKAGEEIIQKLTHIRDQLRNYNDF